MNLDSDYLIDHQLGGFLPFFEPVTQIKQQDKVIFKMEKACNDLNSIISYDHHASNEIKINDESLIKKEHVYQIDTSFNNISSSNCNYLVNKVETQSNTINNFKNDIQNQKVVSLNEQITKESSFLSSQENDKTTTTVMPESLNVYINNVVSSYSTRCHLNLRRIAMEGMHVEYKKENGMVFMKLKKPYTTATIWSSGKVTCAGAKSESDAYKASRRFCRILQNMKFKVKLTNYRVVNVLATCNLPFGIDINKIADAYQKECSYEPELHPGATFKIKELKCTLKLYTTGSITITAPSTLLAQQAINKIYPILNDFKRPFENINNETSKKMEFVDTSKKLVFLNERPLQNQITSTPKYSINNNNIIPNSNLTIIKLNGLNGGTKSSSIETTSVATPAYKTSVCSYKYNLNQPTNINWNKTDSNIKSIILPTNGFNQNSQTIYLPTIKSATTTTTTLNPISTTTSTILNKNQLINNNHLNLNYHHLITTNSSVLSTSHQPIATKTSYLNTIYTNTNSINEFENFNTANSSSSSLAVSSSSSSFSNSHHSNGNFLIDYSDDFLP